MTQPSDIPQPEIKPEIITQSAAMATPAMGSATTADSASNASDGDTTFTFHRFSRRPLPFAVRKAFLTGWGVSLLIHAALAVVFLACSGSSFGTRSANIPSTDDVAEPETQNQPIEPIVNNLKVEPIQVNEAVTPSAKDLPDLPSPPSFRSDDVAAIAIKNGSTDTPSASIIRNAWRGDLPEVTGRQSATGGNGSVDSIYASRFFGASAATACVCYVVDCSGSMVIAFDYVRQELNRAVGQLTPAQNFYIIFFAGDKITALPATQLTRATSANKNSARQFINQIKLTGTQSADAAIPDTGVLNAMQAAFALRDVAGRGVDLIYLLTDGDFDHSQAKETIARLQKSSPIPVRINVVGCGNRDHESFLASLAKTNKGQYTFLSDEDLARGQQTWP